MPSRRAPTRSINDLDGALINFFRVLRDRPEELAGVCSLTPHSREEFERSEALDDPDLSELERARLFWVRVNQGFAKAIGPSTGWSCTVARNGGIPMTIRNRIGRFAAVAERLMATSIEHCDATELIERLSHQPGTVIYADPPYLHSTRRGGRGWRESDYRHEMTEEQHRLLAKALNGTPATVILSGYPSPLYDDDLYVGWHTIDFEVTAHSSNARTSSRTGRTERIWMNRSPGPRQEPLS